MSDNKVQNTVEEYDSIPEESGVDGKQSEPDSTQQELVPSPLPENILGKGISKTLLDVTAFSHRSIGNFASAALISAMYAEACSDRDKYRDENEILIKDLSDEKIKNAELIQKNKSESKVTRFRQAIILFGTLTITIAQKLPSQDVFYIWLLTILGLTALCSGLFFGLDKES